MKIPSTKNYPITKNGKEKCLNSTHRSTSYYVTQIFKILPIDIARYPVWGSACALTGTEFPHFI